MGEGGDRRHKSPGMTEFLPDIRRTCLICLREIDILSYKYICFSVAQKGHFALCKFVLFEGYVK